MIILYDQNSLEVIDDVIEVVIMVPNNYESPTKTDDNPRKAIIEMLQENKDEGHPNQGNFTAIWHQNQHYFYCPNSHPKYLPTIHTVQKKKKKKRFGNKQTMTL
jgi:hypothetical protein